MAILSIVLIFVLLLALIYFLTILKDRESSLEKCQKELLNRRIALDTLETTLRLLSVKTKKKERRKK